MIPINHSTLGLRQCQLIIEGGKPCQRLSKAVNYPASLFQ